MCLYTVCLSVDTVERCFNVLPGVLKFKSVFFFFFLLCRGKGSHSKDKDVFDLQDEQTQNGRLGIFNFVPYLIHTRLSYMYSVHTCVV